MNVFIAICTATPKKGFDFDGSELHEKLQLQLLQFDKNVEERMENEWRKKGYHDDKNINIH